MPRENKSKDTIISCFVRLITEKGYSEVSVSDITREAKISRITFYRNFSTKEDVISSFIQQVVVEVQTAVSRHSAEHSLTGYFEIMFTTIAPYGDVVKELYRANMGDLILSYFNRYLFKTPLAMTGKQMDLYETRFLSGAFYNVLITWIMKGQSESAAEMAGLFSSLIVKKEFSL